MKLERAEQVRDAINGCPDIVGEEQRRNTTKERTLRDPPEHYTGERIKPEARQFQPARVEQSGTLSVGEQEREVYVVVLEPVWKDKTVCSSLSKELVHEIAKHGCHTRFYPKWHDFGPAVWLTDMSQQTPRDPNGDRCPECGSTYWKLDDGEPQCAGCGYTKSQTQLTEVTA